MDIYLLVTFLLGPHWATFWKCADLLPIIDGLQTWVLGDAPTERAGRLREDEPKGL